MTGVSIDFNPAPSSIDDDIRLALKGGSGFAARAQALEDKKTEIEAATARHEAAKAAHDASFKRLNIAGDIVAALENAKQNEAAMMAAYEMADRVQKAVQARADEMIKAAATSAAAELKAAQADRAAASEVLAAANAREREAQAKCDAADRREHEAERALMALQGKADRVNAMLADFVADLPGVAA